MATERITPEWPATAALAKPGTSALSIVVSVSPMRSPVWPQPEPSTSATSCWATPVRSAMTAAAPRATSKGSVAGSDRSRAGDAVSVTGAAYPAASAPASAPAPTSASALSGFGGPRAGCSDVGLRHCRRDRRPAAEPDPDRPGPPHRPDVPRGGAGRRRLRPRPTEPLGRSDDLGAPVDHGALRGQPVPDVDGERSGPAAGHRAHERTRHRPPTAQPVGGGTDLPR